MTDRTAASRPDVKGQQLMIRAAIAPLLAEPRIASEQLTQLLRGHSCMVLEEQSDWLRVAAVDDQYEGWLHRGYAATVGGRDSSETPQAMSLGCLARHTGGVSALPFGALLFVGEEVVSGEVVPMSQMRDRFPATAEAVNATALHYFRNTPYLWGGVTPWGADCSGFVQSIFGAHGIAMKRDSRAQAMLGSESGSDPRNSNAGELLFFSERADRHITHVGIALGNAAMMHVALGRGGASIEDFGREDASDGYAAALLQRFCFARQVI